MKGLGFANQWNAMDGTQARGAKYKPRKSMFTYTSSANVGPSWQLGASPWWTERVGKQKTDYSYTDNIEY